MTVANPTAVAELAAVGASLPLPGQNTPRRLELLSELSRRDLVAGRLIEAHADATAILAELGGVPPAPGDLWGVWAAAATPVQAARDGDDWRLTGTKSWCSGAHLCSRALVSAGDRLFAVDLSAEGVTRHDSDWQGAGMAGADTGSVSFDQVLVTPVGVAGDYLDRPGFWHGAIGVAACWYGGAQAVGDALVRSHARRPLNAHALAHLGGVAAALSASGSALSAAARSIDADPRADAHASALATRAVVERAATEVIDRVGRALGPAPLAMDRRHSQLVADLTVYLRQNHAERDLEALGSLLAANGDAPSVLGWPGSMP